VEGGRGLADLALESRPERRGRGQVARL
jgi:hypothetical protein